MQRKLYLSLICLLFISANALAQVGSGTLKGEITDAETGEALPYVNVVVQEGDRQVGGATSNFEGQYTVKPLEPGAYDVLISYVGYNSVKHTDVVVSSNNITFLDINMKSGVQLEDVEVVEYTKPLINKDGGASGETVTRKDIQKLPGQSATAIAATVGGVQTDSDNNISIRGAREGNTYYYIDGIKVRGSTNLPKSAIEEVSVLTGGIPANYGDATGGIISITTRGASSEFFGGIDVLTSGFKDVDGNGVGLDPYSRTQIEGTFSGPIAFKKDSEGNKIRPLVGFFISGRYRNFMDTRPSVIGNYRIKEEVANELLADPADFEVVSPPSTGAQNEVFITPEGNIQLLSEYQFANAAQVRGQYNSLFLREDDWEKVDARQNDRLEGGAFTAKLDFNPSKDIDLTVGGTFDFSNSQQYSYSNSLLNYQNNPDRQDLTYRGFVRFTQRFPDTQDEESQGGLSNVFYSIMVDYTKDKTTFEDPIHGDNFFNYGYIGKFDITTVNNYTLNSDSLDGVFLHNGFRDINVDFTPSDVNEDLASVTTELFDFYESEGLPVNDLNTVVAANGLRNGDAPEDLYGIYRNMGYRTNNYQVVNNDQVRVTASGSADINDHAIQLGLEYEQRIDRGFSMSPVGLWQVARQSANRHIAELNTSEAIDETTYISGGQEFTFLTFDRTYSAEDQTTFDYNLRRSLGIDPTSTEFINIDELDPSQLSIDMFSADEMLQDGNNRLVTYYGYDYTGKQISGNPSFDDFFDATNEAGERTRPIPAYQPNYLAFYAMDKFTFDDIIFNVGLRVDRFDANQPVLKDPYIVGQGHTVGSQTEFTEHPANIGEDFAIYVNDIQQGDEVVGYRDGDTWYDANGTILDDPTSLRTSTGIAPFLVEPDEVRRNLSSDAFEDYEPQWNWMPRVAFSFPISDEAVFFAHYDILTQRPERFNRLNPINYLFLQNLGQTAINNPNLQPTRTIDYELGFQQVVSKSSSFKISAFYREMRNMIQARQLFQAYPSSYITFDNIDFGTVKGMTMSYDLRQTGNVTIRTSYTLQFASATGSGATSGINLARAGEPNLRIITPTNQDQRHVIITAFDYRYGEGNDYNGPVIGGKDILSNFGVNLVANLGSGTPYSRWEIPIQTAAINANTQGQLASGQPNQARMPWQFRLDLQVDKSFDVYFSKNEEGERGEPALLNVYLLVNNLLNAQNIVDVYGYTGNPDDDGYLTANMFQTQINDQIDTESFKQLYSLKMNSPFNYARARTIQLGVRLDF